MRGAYRNRRRDRGYGTSRSQPNLKQLEFKAAGSQLKGFQLVGRKFVSGVVGD